MAEEIKRPSQLLSTSYSILVGIAVTSFCSLFTLSETSPQWVKPSFIILGIASISLATILFMLERNLLKKLSVDSSNILAEMAEIEKLY